MVVGAVNEDVRVIRCFEIATDYCGVIGDAPPDLETLVYKDSSPDILLDQRHLGLRGEKAPDIIKYKDVWIMAIRYHVFKTDCVEVTYS